MLEGPAIVPNNEPYPSMPWNSPELNFMLSHMSVAAISSVDEGTAIAAPDGSTALTPQGPLNDLMSLRAKFGNLPVLPFPPEAASIVLTNAAQAGEMRIPDGAVLMVIGATASTFVCRAGNADVPTAVLTADGAGQTRSFLVTNGQIFYVGGVKSLSFASPTAGAIVSAMFYSADQMPRF
jgi:hypothetical protein